MRGCRPALRTRGSTPHGSTTPSEATDIRKLRVILATLALLSATVPFLVVPSVNAACSGGRSSITVYPNANGGGTPKTFCASSDVSNLASIGSGSCLPFPSWNDCISSVTVDIVSGSSLGVCLWTDSGYQGDGLRFISDRTKYNLGSTWNDKVSSIEWGSGCLTD